MALSILIAEDTDYVAELLRCYFTDIGHTVQIAENGALALLLYESAEKKPDVVVTDLVMPRINGVTLIERLKASYPAQPIVLMTAQTNEDLEKSGATALVQKHGIPVVYKPLDLENLLAVVNSLVRSNGANTFR